MSEGVGSEQGDSLLVSLQIDRGSYVTGDRIVMNLAVTAAGRDSVVVEFPTSQRYDFKIVGSDGREVWRWSSGYAFLQVFGREVVGAGGLNWSESWVAEMPAGRYRVIGSLTLASGLASDTAYLELRD